MAATTTSLCSSSYTFAPAAATLNSPCALNLRKDLVNMLGNVDEDENPTAPSRLDENIESLRSFANVSIEKVSKLIRSGNSKSCALDPMPTSFVKVLLPVLLPAIHSIIKKSLGQSHMPCTLREAIVKPLIKKPAFDTENFKNFQPSIFRKIN